MKNVIKSLTELRFVFIVFAMLPCVSRAAEIDINLLKKLDSYLEKRAFYIERKENRIDSLKQIINKGSYSRRMMAYENIFDEYYTYCYDSAFVYNQQQMNLATMMSDESAQKTCLMHKALLMAIGGFYSQAEDIMQEIDPQTLSLDLQYNYYNTLLWLYNYWSSYCSDEYLAPEFTSKRIVYLKKINEVLSSDTLNGNFDKANYYYMLGEEAFLTDVTGKSSISYYKNALKHSSPDQRVYACAAYGVARSYRLSGDSKQYVKYLVDAAISDIVCPLKENLALQELSLYIYNLNHDNCDIAAKYIAYSMEDAQFYNNRLRILEISKIMPIITEAYRGKIQHQKHNVEICLAVVCILSLALGIVLIVLFRYYRKLNQSRHNVHLQMEKVMELNKKLESTNVKRETYLRLFMDISAAYIEKLSEYRKLVSRKLKAGQADDLLKRMGSYKLQAEDVATFNSRFDKAFMELYPNFVDEFNSLLTPENRIVLPTPTSLTPEIRIFALMRLGVTESRKIATLLSYSPQTVYNHKTAMRNKAIDRERFDEDINRLCKIIQPQSD